MQSLSIKAEKKLKNEILNVFHKTADLEHVVCQLNGESGSATEIPPPVYILRERCLAAKLFLEPMTDTLFAELVETLTSLNRRFEGAASRRQPTLKWNDR